MTGPVRLAGSGRAGDTVVTWTMAEGRRGRRWREVLTRDGSIVHSLLLETDAERRFSHLELSVPGVLVTLHPEPDGTLHGNRVTTDGAGIDHLVGHPIGVTGLVRVAGSVLGDASIAWALSGVIASPGAIHRPMVVIDPAGRVGPVGPVELERERDGGWRIGGGEPFRVTEDGVPVLAHGRIVPLEV